MSLLPTTATSLKVPCLLATPQRFLPVECLSLITGLGRQAVGHVIEIVAVYARNAIQ